MTGLQGFWISIIKNLGPKVFVGLEYLANDPDPEYQALRARVAAAKEKTSKVARLIGFFITLSIFIVLATCWHEAEQQRAREKQPQAVDCPGYPGLVHCPVYPVK